MALVQTEDAERREWLAIEFERHRAHLRAVGYRMLGSMTEADDAVQEDGFASSGATRETPMTCAGGSRSRSVGSPGHAPQPEVEARDVCRHVAARAARDVAGADIRAESNPESDAVMADSVGIALLVVLETLSPPERLAFVLHDVFGVGFDEIAVIVDRTPTAARQLASRARRRVRAEAPEPDADLAVQRQVVDAFVAAARAGDFEALLRVLDPDVVVTTDGGGRGPSRAHRCGDPPTSPIARVGWGALRVVCAAGHRQRAGGTRRRWSTRSATHHRVVPAPGGQDHGDPVQRRSRQDEADRSPAGSATLAGM